MGSQYKRGEGVIDSVTVQEVGGQVHNHSNQRGRGSQYKRWTGQEFKVQARGGGGGGIGTVIVQEEKGAGVHSQ